MTTPEIAVQSGLNAQLTRDIVTEEPWLRRWTREEYDRMIDAGILTTQDKVQLIEGEIVEMSPPKSPHATSVSLATKLFTMASDEQHVRIQLPLALGSDSEPEPDVSIVVGSPRDYKNAHPTTALLVVEVSDSTLKFDRTQKARVYARAGISEYWILNLRDRCIEVHRDPVVGVPPEEPRYTTLTIHKPGESITPLSMPQQSIAVDDLLP